MKLAAVAIAAACGSDVKYRHRPSRDGSNWRANEKSLSNTNFAASLFAGMATSVWPETVPEEAAPSAKNNDSLVRRLRYGSQTLLLPGDAEKEVEREILSERAVRKKCIPTC